MIGIGHKGTKGRKALRVTHALLLACLVLLSAGGCDRESKVDADEEYDYVFNFGHDFKAGEVVELSSIVQSAAKVVEIDDPALVSDEQVMMRLIKRPLARDVKAREVMRYEHFVDPAATTPAARGK